MGTSKTLQVTPPKKTRSKLLFFSPDEFKKIQKDAKKYADGNVSAWIRHCVANYSPEGDNKNGHN